MEFRLDPENKKVEIIGLGPSSIGAVPIQSFDSLLARVEALEKKLPGVYDLQINASNGLTTIVSINNSQIGSAAGNYDLASVFKAMSTTVGKETPWSALTANGTSLEQRWAEGIVPTSPRGIIQKGGLSHIVLQELSNRPLVDPALFFQYVRLFCFEIKQYNPTAKIYLFENWPYLDSANYQADLNTMDANYRSMAAETGAIIIPNGIAWNILRSNPGFTALSPYFDNRHPNLIGIYLNACVCLGRILGISPLGNSFIPVGISAADAAKIQDAANKSLTATAANPFKEFAGTTTVKEGMLIGSINFRASSLEIYAANVNWNNGSAQIMTPNGTGVKESWTSYPTTNTCSILIYQDPTKPVEISGTLQAPQIVSGLDVTKPIYVSVNDGNYSNNTGGFTIGYR